MLSGIDAVLTVLLQHKAFVECFLFVCPDRHTIDDPVWIKVKSLLCKLSLSTVVKAAFVDTNLKNEDYEKVVGQLVRSSQCPMDINETFVEGSVAHGWQSYWQANGGYSPFCSALYSAKTRVPKRLHILSDFKDPAWSRLAPIVVVDVKHKTPPLKLTTVLGEYSLFGYTYGRGGASCVYKTGGVWTRQLPSGDSDVITESDHVQRGVHLAFYARWPPAHSPHLDQRGHTVIKQ